MATITVNKVTVGNGNIKVAPVTGIVEFVAGDSRCVATIMSMRKPVGNRTPMVAWAVTVITHKGIMRQGTLEGAYLTSDAEREMVAILARFVRASDIEPEPIAVMTMATEMASERIPGVVGVL